MKFEALPTYLTALSGGVFIGLAIALLLLWNGRIAGISGIVAGVVRPEPSGWTWRALFVVGLLGGGVVAAIANPKIIAAPTASLPILAIAGLLVGVGTRIAGGCTSGHGVCGASRPSLRSIAATGTFMAAGALVVLLVHWGGIR